MTDGSAGNAPVGAPVGAPGDPVPAPRGADPARGDATTDGLPQPRRLWSVVTLCLGITMAVLDGSIANLALPTLARELAVSPAASIWVVNAYQLAITVSLLPLAALGEISGYRRVYLWGLGLFTLASAACALSGSLEALVASRVVQGFGAAAILSVNSALMRFSYPRAMLGRAIGVIALVVAVSSAVGPTVAGGILAVADWPWLFAVNLPIGAAVLLIGPSTLPETPRARRRFDVSGALLSALAFGLLISALDGVGHGENPLSVLARAAVAAAAGYVLVRRERRAAAPLLPLDLLRIPALAFAVGTSVCSFLAQMLAYSALPFRLQGGLGFSAVETGLLMTPWPLATAVVAPIAGRLADRHAAGLLGGVGLGLFALGLLALALLPAQPAVADIAWRMALCGAGFGLFQSPNNRAMIGAAPIERAGAAGGVLSTARLLGQTTGTALVALVLARFAQGAGQGGGVAAGQGAADAGAQGGPVFALFLAAAIAAVAAGVSCTRLLRPGRG